MAMPERAAFKNGEGDITMALNCWFPQDVERIIAQAIDALVCGEDEHDEARLEMAHNIAVGFGLRPARPPDQRSEWDKLKGQMGRDSGL